MSRYIRGFAGRLRSKPVDGKHDNQVYNFQYCDETSA